MANKAHSATVRRLQQRYQVQVGETFDLAGRDNQSGKDLIIEVETAATLADGIRKLLHADGRRFVAMTNQESIGDALSITRATQIGVMSPRGDIVKEAD
ncbi:MAG: hypothetical protein WD872_12555 [Pirellulaceae bacterium]